MQKKAVIIGAGVVGSSVALELARSGWNVRLVERNPAVGTGSTALSSTVIRCHYTRPDAIRLAHEGRHVWEHWAEYTGLSSPRAHYCQTGVLFLLRKGSSDGPAPNSLGVKAEMDEHGIDERCTMMREAGVEVELLDAGALVDRFNALRPPDPEIVGVWEPKSGYVAYPTAAVEDLAEAATLAGVELRTETTVVGADLPWRGATRAVESVRVRGPQGEETWPCDALINCAGPDSAALNLELRCPVALNTAPQRQFIIEAEWANARPDVPAMADLAEGFYVRPDPHVFKIGAVLPQEHVAFVQSPDGAAPREEIAAFEASLLERLHRRIHGVELQNVTTRVAYYDWSVSDSYPILDGTDVGGYYVAIGTSGAWFKGAPVIGAFMAALVERDFSGSAETRFALSHSGASLAFDAFSASIGRIA